MPPYLFWSVAGVFVSIKAREEKKQVCISSLNFQYIAGQHDCNNCKAFVKFLYYWGKFFFPTEILKQQEAALKRGMSEKQITCTFIYEQYPQKSFTGNAYLHKHAHQRLVFFFINEPV